MNPIVPYLTDFAIISSALRYGLMKRHWWMWCIGLVFLHLFASYFGACFFSALYDAKSGRDFLFAGLYLVGGLVLWVPSVIWWHQKRRLFGLKPLADSTPISSPKNCIH